MKMCILISLLLAACSRKKPEPFFQYQGWGRLADGTIVGGPMSASELEFALKKKRPVLATAGTGGAGGDAGSIYKYCTRNADGTVLCDVRDAKKKPAPKDSEGK